MSKTLDLPIYWQYYKLISSGKKTIEVRAGYESIRNLQSGDVIRFRSKNQTCEMIVVRKTEYKNARELLHEEDCVLINPMRNREQQIKDICDIYPPKKQELGMFAIELKPAY